MPLPKKLQNEPQLELGLELFYLAFWDLSTCRHDLGPIPWTAMFTYCQEYDIIDEQREDMFTYIREMDTVFMKHMSKKK